MAILKITTDLAGQSSVDPRLVRLLCTDNLATITTAGYLNSLNNNGYNFKPTDFIFAAYGNQSPTAPIQSIFVPTFGLNGQITLTKLV